MTHKEPKGCPAPGACSAMITLTQGQALNIVNAHEINLDDGEETEMLEANNPELADAYRALLEIAKGA